MTEQQRNLIPTRKQQPSIAAKVCGIITMVSIAILVLIACVWAGTMLITGILMMIESW